MLDKKKLCRTLQKRFGEHYRRIRKPKNNDTFLYQHFKRTAHSPNNVIVQPVEKISYDENSSVIIKNIKRFETELKWIKLLQTSFPLRFNDSIYHEGNISKIPDFDVLTLSESRKRKSRSHGIRKKGNDKRKRCAAMKLNTSLNDLAVKLRIYGRHPMLSYLSSLPNAVLRSLDTEANRFYDRNHQMYDAALLTRCYIYIFIAVALDESIFLDVLHFPMKNIMSRDLEATPKGEATSKPIQ